MIQEALPVHDTRELQPSTIKFCTYIRKAITDLMRICPHRNPECASEAEVCQLQVVSFVNEKILWFKIAMQDTMRMAIEEAGV